MRPCEVVSCPKTMIPAPHDRKKVFPFTRNPDAEVSKSTAHPSGPASYSPRVLKSVFTIELLPFTVPMITYFKIRWLAE